MKIQALSLLMAIGVILALVCFRINQMQKEIDTLFYATTNLTHYADQINLQQNQTPKESTGSFFNAKFARVDTIYGGPMVYTTTCHSNHGLTHDSPAAP